MEPVLILATLLALFTSASGAPQAAPHQDPTVAAELRALIDGGRDLEAARARATAEGLEVLVLVTGDRVAGAPDEALSLQEQIVVGVALADPRVGARLRGRRLVVSVPGDLAARRAFERSLPTEGPPVNVASETKALLALAPPALALLDESGQIARALERLAPLDAGTVAAWLDGAVRRIDVPDSDHAGQAYLAVARAPLARQPAYAAAWLAEHAPAEAASAASPWATKVRARAALPEAVGTFELLRAPLNDRIEHRVVEEARVRLAEAQLADGSFLGGPRLSTRHASLCAALALHRVGDHDAAQRAVAWLAPSDSRADVAQFDDGGDVLLATLWLDVQLVRHGVGWSRSEEVDAAIAALTRLATTDGGWSGSALAADGFSVATRADSVCTGFALDALQRALAAQFAVDPSLIERALATLQASRAGDNGFEDTVGLGSSGDADSGYGCAALTFPALAALARTGAIKRHPISLALSVYLGEGADLRAASGSGGVGRRPPALTGETRALGWLGYARLSGASPGRPFLRRDGELRRSIVAAARADSTWVDACEQGWVAATALALVALEETR